MRRNRSRLILLSLSLSFAIETVGLDRTRLSFAIRLWFDLQGFGLAELLAIPKLLEDVKIQDDENPILIRNEANGIMSAGSYFFPLTKLALYPFNRTKHPFLNLPSWTK